jgi:hypothetical protein
MEYARLNVRIGKKTMELLNRLSGDYGMSKTGLVAYILGQFCNNYEQFMTDLPERLKSVLIQKAQEINVHGSGSLSGDVEHRIREIRHYHDNLRNFMPGDDDGAATYGVIMRSQIQDLLQILDAAEPGADA